MENVSEALEAIRRYVWSGFYNAGEIVKIIEDAELELEEVNSHWVLHQVELEFRRKESDEARWPAVTDCDRLDRVFLTLNNQGILALQNAGYTLSEGLSDIGEAYRKLGDQRAGVVGYCFYNGQDLERVMDTRTLYIAFGDLRGNEAKGLEVGHRIQRVLETAGFSVKWPGSTKARLKIEGLHWQRSGSKT